jgi:hypothetical protein
VHTAGNQTCTACPANSTTTGSTAITGVNGCVCDAGYMDSSALGYTLCSSAKPCPSGGFCTFEYGGGEGLCLSCENSDVVPRSGTNSTAPCCSAASSYFSPNGFLSGDGVKACYAACRGTEPGPRGSSCKATTSVTRRSGGDNSSGSGSSYNAYYRQDSQILHLAVILLYMCPHTIMCPHTAVCVSSNYYMCAHTTHTKARLTDPTHCCPHTTIYVSSHHYIGVLNTKYLCGYFGFSYTTNM